MSIGKHYNTKKSIPESLCTDLLKNVDLFIGLVGLHQVSVFGWCYFILPCFFLPCICPISFGTSDVTLVLGFHFNS